MRDDILNALSTMGSGVQCGAVSLNIPDHCLTVQTSDVATHATHSSEVRGWNWNTNRRTHGGRQLKQQEK